MKEKDHAHLSRTESDQLPLFQPILKQRKDCEENETNIEHSSAEQRVNTLMISETEPIFRVVKE